jgi:hypothetical protein
VDVPSRQRRPFQDRRDLAEHALDRAFHLLQRSFEGQPVGSIDFTVEILGSLTQAAGWLVV